MWNVPDDQQISWHEKHQRIDHGGRTEELQKQNGQILKCSNVRRHLGQRKLILGPTTDTQSSSQGFRCNYSQRIS
jgi:hypothetical protein